MTSAKKSAGKRAPRTASKTATKKTQPQKETTNELALLDQMSSLVGYEPHPVIPGEVLKHKPFVRLPFNVVTEGLESLDVEDIPITFPSVKLLHGQSQEVDLGLDGAKAGVYWHVQNSEALPDKLDVVAVHTYPVKYPPSELNPEGSTVMFVVFTPSDFLESYNEWIHRALDLNELELGRELITNVFTLGFQSTGLQEYRKLQSNALNSGSLYSQKYRLGTRDKQNTKGRWKNVTLVPAGRLTPEEIVVARSMKELVREVHSHMERYYEKRREEMGLAEMHPQDTAQDADVSDV